MALLFFVIVLYDIFHHSNASGLMKLIAIAGVLWLVITWFSELSKAHQ